MRKKALLSLILLVLFFANSLQAQGYIPYKDSSLPIEQRVEDLVSRMTLEEKVVQLVGNSLQYRQEAIRGNERLGIPNFIIMHGPYGAKFKRTPKMVIGTYFPVSIAMAATWSDELVAEITGAMGAEMNSWGGLANAGPAMNIIRDPRTGRSFEYFTEDPYLNGRIAAAYTRGLQSQRVAVILKHYICNNQELNRHAINVKVSERALREIYFPGFKRAVEEDAKIIMGAYNRVNDLYSCENDFILTKVLRDEWGFDGFVLSDWSGTRSTAASANNGLDVEMPRERYYGKALLQAVEDGELGEETIDRMVSNVLRVLFWTGAFDEGPVHDKSIVRSEKHLDLARKVSAKSIVLLKNSNNILPLDQNENKKIAVIGPNGAYGDHFRGGNYNISLLQGGGSASLGTKEENMVTPFMGIKNNAAEDVEVTYVPGCYAESGCGPIPLKYLKTPDGGSNGLQLSYFGNAKFEGNPIRQEISTDLSYIWGDELDIPEAGLEMVDKSLFSIEFRAILTAPATREYIFEVRNEWASAQLFIDGKPVAENTKGSRVFWNDMGTVNLEEGKEYELLVKLAKGGDRMANLSINWDFENVAYMEEAKKLAANSDVVILTVGLSGAMGEQEAGDRTRMELFPAQEKLINEISAINSNCVVVIVAGSAVTMDNWLENVQAVLFAWYPGEQGGNGMADIIFGKENPGGRLPITFAGSASQYPEDFYSLTHENEYKEGIYVGYRYFEKEQKKPLFPFGYGLSYTSFDYSNLNISLSDKAGKISAMVTADITNTGSRDGDEVVQLYIHDVKSSVHRPVKELKDFRRIYLNSGETRKVSFILEEDAFSFWDDRKKEWIAEPGEFEIKIGSSSEDIRLQGIMQFDFASL